MYQGLRSLWITPSQINILFIIYAFLRKKTTPSDKKFSKGEKRWRFTNTSPFLWSSCWVYFADEIWGSLWLPIPFSIPLPASASPLSYGDQIMRPHFEMIDDLSFWNDIQIYFRLIKGKTVALKWVPLSLRNEDMTAFSIWRQGIFLPLFTIEETVIFLVIWKGKNFSKRKGIS